MLIEYFYAVNYVDIPLIRQLLSIHIKHNYYCYCITGNDPVKLDVSKN